MVDAEGCVYMWGAAAAGQLGFDLQGDNLTSPLARHEALCPYVLPLAISEPVRGPMNVKQSVLWLPTL